MSYLVSQVIQLAENTSRHNWKGQSTASDTLWRGVA